MKLKKENICTLLFCFFLSFLFISFGFNTAFLDYMKEDMTTKIVDFISKNDYYNFATLYFPIIDNLLKILNELFYACFHILAFAILIVYTILKKKTEEFTLFMKRAKSRVLLTQILLNHLQKNILSQTICRWMRRSS